jgi:DNA modification methylase
MLNPEYDKDGVTLYCGDCLEVLRGMEACSVDAVVTDPPYGLSFMGKKWDYDVPSVEIWAECLRVLKPGGHLLSFAGTRTQHRMAVRIEDAGFEIRDMIAWVYGSGFPKSHNLKGDWNGWGTALKPALEPITMARKPFDGTVAANVLEHGTGAINVDGCRVEAPDGVPLFSSRKEPNGKTLGDGLNGSNRTGERGTGRWPANFIHDGSQGVLDLFPETGGGHWSYKQAKDGGLYKHGLKDMEDAGSDNVKGSAARFFYCPKASKADRDEGCEGMEERHVSTLNDYSRPSEGRTADKNGGPKRNNHPTVKPTDLMRYLCRLVTPPGGIVLDPFMGSGSTGRGAAIEGFKFLGIERETEFVGISVKRIESVLDNSVEV